MVKKQLNSVVYYPTVDSPNQMCSKLGYTYFDITSVIAINSSTNTKALIALLATG